MPARDPSLAEVLNRFKSNLFNDLRVSLPARVERYDADKQLVDVKPLVALPFTEADGTVSQVPIGIINAVPVVFPGAGGYRITFPVAVGDTVLLVFADRSIDAWQSEGSLASPVDERAHHVSDAIAIPGLHPNNDPWTGASTSALTMGKDGGPQVVCTASSVQLGASDAVPATEAVVLGTTYRTAEDAFFLKLETLLLPLAQAALVMANGTCAPDFAAPPNNAVKTALIAAETAFKGPPTAFSTFLLGIANYLSTIVKSR